MTDPAALNIPLDLQTRLQTCTSLPSPPKVVLQIIDMIQDPELEIEQVIETLSKDPALSLKILRMANSAHYAYQHKVNTIEKAIMIIGLNGILSLSLSFSLANSLRAHQGEGLNYKWYWLRALIAGSTSHILAELCRRRDVEALFTAGFIQDIGMLALDHIEPLLYTNIDVQHVPHHTILAHEKEQLGTTHADIGSWLLTQWHFPNILSMAIRYSDEPNPTSLSPDAALFSQFITLAGSITDLYLTQAGDEEILTISDQLDRELGRGSMALPEIIKMIERLVNANADLFEIDCDEGFAPDRIYEQARDLLVNRHIRTPQPLEVLSSNIASLKSI